MMALLSRDAIIAVQDIRHEDVEVPEWGGTVRIRGLTARERSLMEATFIAVRGEKLEIKVDALQTMREKLVAAALTNEEGQRLFGDNEIRELGKKSSEVIQRLFDKAQDLSGMSEAAVTRAEGNSAAGQNGSSGSDLPNN
jgi:hypothetical protein